MTVITISRKDLKTRAYKKATVEKNNTHHKRSTEEIAKALKRAIADIQEDI